MSPNPSNGAGTGVTAQGTGFAIGVDLGGTNLRVGLVDADGQVLRATNVPSSTGLPPETNLTYLGDVIEGLLAAAPGERAALRGIGIGTSGPVDTSTGLIDNPFTLPAWSGVSLRAPLAERFDCRVWIDNDASAAALGEYWRGAGMGSERLAMVTIGTGIGGALVVAGRAYHGAHGFHPEVGHHIVDPSAPACYCGATGCWESLIAGPAIARAWTEVLRAREDDVAGTSEDFFAAMRAGDAEAQRLGATISRYLGLGLQNVVAFYAPDVTVLGGGVARHFDLLEPGLRAVLAEAVGCQPPGGMAVRASLLADAAGILGAAYMVFSADS